MPLKPPKGPKMTFDLYGVSDAAPTVIFVHGGYRRALDKRGHVFLAEELPGGGLNVVNVNDDLCPNLTRPQSRDRGSDPLPRRQPDFARVRRFQPLRRAVRLQPSSIPDWRCTVYFPRGDFS